MNVKALAYAGMCALVGLLLVSVLSATAAANTVPISGLADRQVAITANALKPAMCAGLDLTAVVAGSGIITGTNASELMLGSSGADTINGGGGNDCILGGDGIDHLFGNGGTDVCIGGAGVDALDLSCETQYQ